MEEIIKIIVLLILLIVVVFIAAFILSVITKFGALLFVGLLVYVIMKRMPYVIQKRILLIQND